MTLNPHLESENLERKLHEEQRGIDALKPKVSSGIREVEHDRKKLLDDERVLKDEQMELARLEVEKSTTERILHAAKEAEKAAEKTARDHTLGTHGTH
jgi:rRNA maturation endonuclease Nob1